MIFLEVQQPIGGFLELGEVDQSSCRCRDDDQAETGLGEGVTFAPVSETFVFFAGLGFNKTRWLLL